MGKSGLTRRQEAAIVALLREPTITRAAKAAGVHEATLHRWLAADAFANAYRQSRRQAFIQSIAMLQQCAPLAVQTIARLMVDPDAPPHVRVAAGATLLRCAKEGMAIDDLAARVEKIEHDGDR